MGEIKKVEITGEELERRIRVQLEFSVQDAEAMLNQELMKAVANKISHQFWEKNKKAILKKIDLDTISEYIVKAIVQKAVFNLALEMADQK